ncbi:MAG: methyltransferase domain-containing protein [Gammaproteobacteria bacterium]|nr:methyltransferase domain-containing protein [Gammaproteobacteria bacterium]MBU1722344.1 methyltransferase domain-containing protein [Gammaproteobacteria bacterium]MBU2004719.1 methyltransferase domain-containing protein [Gammaproteobacteria bacterium]
MKVVLQIILAKGGQQRILDIPAGNGLLAQKLREHGHTVICGDINEEQEHYIFADMSGTLPFQNGEFDTVVCMEGIEHVITPSLLVSELCRICKPGGRIILSLPNIQNLYSRLQFMCSGTFYQFPPFLPEAHHKTEKVDLGHISSLSYVQLRYLFSYFGAKVTHVSGDKYKRKFLTPILLPFVAIGWLWFKVARKPDETDPALFSNRKLLLSRSLIMVLEKE